MSAIEKVEAEVTQDGLPYPLVSLLAQFKSMARRFQWLTGQHPVFTVEQIEQVIKHQIPDQTKTAQ